MQALSGTVGEDGVNARHDTALIQAQLVLAQRPADLDRQRAHYLDTIDGDCGPRTKRALVQFQNDHVFVGANGHSSAAIAGATAGRVSPGDATWAKLVAATPLEMRDLRVLVGSKTVYIAAAEADRAGSVNDIAGLTFQTDFRNRLVTLIQRLHSTYGIVCWVCPDGDRRTFQTQYGLLVSGRNVTRAGPGESNHNFGQAADLGFEGLRWLRADGTVVDNEDAWLHQLDPRQRATGESLFFWNVLRAIGIAVGLHRGPLADRPHLQAWDDAGIDMAARLAAHLSSVGQMRWTGRSQRYQCDLGFGGRFFDVGSAAQIWSGQGTVTESTLTQARAQVAGSPAQTPATAADVAAMRAALRVDFDAAESRWREWRPR